MPVVVSPYISFPNLYWWLQVAGADRLLLDPTEHFQKMSYRNRYYISGSNGLIQLSIPLVNGRDQRAAMQNVNISYDENWQVQHWRTLVSVYARTPYFLFYEPSLRKIFDTSFTKLSEFNLASVRWLSEQLRVKVEMDIADAYKANYSQEDIDLRKSFKPGIEKTPITDLQPYYQIFADRTGFLPNLSMLDLLFAEGPHSMQWLQKHKDLVLSWGERKDKI
ncbi:MAG: hypothetical protein EOP56_03815 [Sphingobacteriales bacterium]|nr:MAG: hypothetical protein EOP56_03815 [Sphingobacteriales bacterium]